MPDFCKCSALLAAKLIDLHFPLQVPFGNIPSVKNWMKVEGKVTKPANEIPSKPIEGFNCTREEQSGKRFWGVIEELCGEPEVFFSSCFVYNICPAAFLHASGRNITPPEIKVSSRLILVIF